MGASDQSVFMITADRLRSAWEHSCQQRSSLDALPQMMQLGVFRSVACRPHSLNQLPRSHAEFLVPEAIEAVCQALWPVAADDPGQTVPRVLPGLLAVSGSGFFCLSTAVAVPEAKRRPSSDVFTRLFVWTAGLRAHDECDA
ncbi:hypothetical protein ACJZ2D_012126 [Fusarium nematophilum]